MKPPTSKKELHSLIGCLVLIRQFLETRLDERIRSDTFSNLMFTWTEKADKASEKNKKPTLPNTGHLISRLCTALQPYHRCQ